MPCSLDLEGARVDLKNGGETAGIYFTPCEWQASDKSPQVEIYFRSELYVNVIVGTIENSRELKNLIVKVMGVRPVTIYLPYFHEITTHPCMKIFTKIKLQQCLLAQSRIK